MKKVLLIIGIGLLVGSCSYESVYNTTTTTTTTNETDNSHDNSTVILKDSTKIGFIVKPWINKDSLITIGDTING